MKSEKKTLNGGQIAMAMIVLTAVSKILGFSRELLLANYYGAGTVIDAFSMAQDIPDTVFATVIQIVGTAFLPIFSRKAEQGDRLEADLFTSRVYNFLLSAAGVMIVLCILFPGFFLNLFAPGFSQEAYDLSKFYLRIATFMLIGHVTIVIFEPYLRYKGSYLAPVILGFFQSIFVIGFTVLSAKTMPQYLIFGVPLGVIMQGMMLIYYARKKAGYHYTPSFRYGNSVREVFALSLPILISSLAVRLNAFFDRMLASGFEAGSISALRYGHLVVNLISAFSYSIVGTIVYPNFNKLAAQEKYEELGKAAHDGNHYCFMLTLPLAIGGMIFSNQIISLIYERGAFDGAATALTAAVFFWYALGIPFHGVSSIVAYVFYALKDIKTTVYCSLLSVAVNAVLNFVLSYLMGVEGLALATTIAAAVHMVVLLICFKRKHGNIRLFESMKPMALTLVSAIVSVSCAYLFFMMIGNSLLHFILAVVVAVVLYLVMMLLLGVVSVSMVKDMISLKKNK